MEESEGLQNSSRLMEPSKIFNSADMENFNQYLATLSQSLIIVDRQILNIGLHDDISQQVRFLP